MNGVNDIHKGHRSRMLEKVKTGAVALAEHELLETLLFYALPRVDTNPLAHRLIKTFGELNKVLCASYNELINVDGVGEKTALLIMTMGATYKKACAIQECRTIYKNFETINKEAYKQFTVLDREQFLMMMLDKNYKKIKQYFSEDAGKSCVKVDLAKIAQEISACKPVYVVIAHNHVGGSCLPSEDDDLSTYKINALCELHGVNLIEHVIFNRRGQTFSYKKTNRLEQIKERKVTLTIE